MCYNSFQKINYQKVSENSKFEKNFLLIYTCYIEFINISIKNVFNE